MHAQEPSLPAPDRGHPRALRHLTTMARPLPPLALAYHGVGDVSFADDPHSLFTRPDSLRSHIRLLRRWGYRFTTFGDLAARRERGLVALTFDDGLADNLHALAPLLAEEGVPATVFVSSAHLDGRHPDPPHAPMLTVAELRTLAGDGARLEIGAHGHVHRDLTALSYEEAVDELRRARRILEGIVGRPVEVLAYPYGAADDDTRRAARDAGYAAAARASGCGRWTDPWDLPRQDMHSYSGSLGLRLKRRGWYRPLMGTLPGRAVRSLTRRAKGRLR
jgi:peptidoglycan/xylan/chitin deacetylase (PgdA/CDA1 family)